ncbi:MAG: hypothetical protein Q9163_004259 [Psora crenata]
MASPRQPNKKENKRNGNAVREFECSNSTTAAFLGGKRKDWMTVPPSPSKISAREGHESSRIANSSPVPRGAISPSGNDNIAVMNTNANAAHIPAITSVSQADHGHVSSPRRRTSKSKGQSTGTTSKPPQKQSSSPELVVEQVRQVPVENSTNRQVYTENTLPSPNPSEDRNHERDHTIPMRDPVLSSMPHEGATTRRFEQLMAKYGSVEEIEKQLQLAERPSATQIQLSTPGAVSQTGASVGMNCELTSSIPGQVPFRMLSDRNALAVPPHKRGHLASSKPRKRAQHQLRPQLEPTFWSSLGGAYTRRLQGKGQEYESLMQQCFQTVFQRTEYVSTLNNRGLTEQSRLFLLREACSRQDHAFLLLHQLYCLRRANAMPFGAWAAGISSIQEDVLETLKKQLQPNEDLPLDAMAWFVQFPGPLTMANPNSGGNNSSLSAAQLYARVLSTLTAVAWYEQGLRRTCATRCWPPLVSELLVKLQIDSVMLQLIVFRIILSQIFIPPHDCCFGKHEQIFLRNQSHIMGDDPLVGRPHMRENNELTFMHEHIEVWQSHTTLHVIKRPEPPGPSTVTNSTMAAQQPHQKQFAGRSVPCILPQDIRFVEPSTSLQAIQQEYNGANFSPALASGHLERNAGPLLRNPVAMNRHPYGHQQGHPWGESQPGGVTNQGGFTQPGGVAHPASLLQYQVTPQNPQNYDILANQTSRGLGLQARNRSMPSNVSTSPQYMLPPGVSPSLPGIGDQVQHTTHPLHNSVRRASGPAASTTTNMQQWPVPLGRAASAGSPVLNNQHHLLPSTPTFGPFQIPTQQAQHTTRIQHASHAHGAHPLDAPTGRLTSMPSPNFQNTLSMQANSSTTALPPALPPSPTMTSSVGEQTDEKCFRFIKTVHRPPKALTPNMQYQQYSVNLDRAEIELLAKDIRSTMGATPTRCGPPGCRTYRVRCLKSKLGTAIPVDEAWVVADHTWPSCLTLLLNDEVLELPRKSLYGKDLPVDVTRIVREGPNTLTMAVLDLRGNDHGNEQYVIGLEAVQVISHSDIMEGIPFIEWRQARQRILSKAILGDPDIEIIGPEITVDVTDPFTARIFEVPARGRECSHDQCFDLKTFLSTRTSNGKNKKAPCSPDEFKCPICRGDVRPGSLVIDGFLTSVRVRLLAAGLMEVTKAIIIYPDGNWVAKEEKEDVSGERGDVDGRRVNTERRGTANDSFGKELAEITVVELDN